MIFKNPKTGKIQISKPEFTSPELEAKRDAKYGKGNWEYIENVCSYIAPSCGYGEPKNKENCVLCNGKCLRPIGR